MYRNRDLERALKKIHQGYYILPPADRHFRVSSLPYCPLIHVINAVNNPERRVEFESGFYFHMGHAIHSLWQTTGQHVLPDNLVGDWRCQRVLKTSVKNNTEITHRCSTMAKFCTLNEAAANTPCPHGHKSCRDQLAYSELELAWRGMTGHTDFMYRWPKRKNSYSLVDIKTTGNFLFDAYKKAVEFGYYPSKKYIEQLETYCIILEHHYKIRIEDYSIAYQAREKATQIGRDKKTALRIFTFKLTDQIRRKRLKNMRRYRRGFDVANKWLAARGRARSKLTEQLYDIRPCHRHKDYHETMAWAFFDSRPCEYHAAQECYNGQMLRRLTKLERTADQQITAT